MRLARAGRRAGATLALLLGITLTAQQARADEPGELIVRLPADAELYVLGTKSKQVGPVRKFDTPPLAPGKEYVYPLKAVWQDGGKEVVREEKAVLRAGKTTEVDLTPPPPAKEGSFKVELGDKALKLLPGETKTLAVRLKRDQFKELVVVTFSGLPKGVKADEAVLAGDQDAVEAKLSAAPDAAPGTAEVTVAATAGKLRETATFTLTVEKKGVAVEPPPPPATLKVLSGASVTLKPGAEATAALFLEGAHLEKPVDITFAGLPEGVTAAALTVPVKEGAIAAKATVKATTAAKPGSTTVKVLARSGTLKAEGELKVTVEKLVVVEPPPPPPATLKVLSAAAVTLKPGGEATAALSLEGARLEKPVEISFEGLPEGVTAAPLSVPVKEGVMAGKATFKATDRAKSGTATVKVLARSGTTRAEGELKVTVEKTVAVEPPPAPGMLKVLSGVSVTLQAGGEATAALYLEGARLEKPIEVTFEGLPEGVTAAPVSAPAKEGTFAVKATLKAAGTVKAGTKTVKVLARSGTLKAESELKLIVEKSVAVEPPPPPPATLKVLSAAAVTLKPGGEATAALSLEGARLEKPVEISFEGLPEGVTAAPLSVPARDGTLSASATFKATDAAKGGAATVKVIARSGTLKAEGELKLTVETAAGSAAALRLSAPGALELQASGRTVLFPILVVREGCSGPVTLTVGGLPPGVTLKTRTVAADRGKVYLEASAGTDAAEGESEITLRGALDSVKGTLVLKVVVKK